MAGSAVLVLALLVVGTVSPASAAPPSDTVLAWGFNILGQLGNGTNTNSNTPVPVSLPAGTTVTAVGAGDFHSLALTSTGKVLASGNNFFGQLGNTTNTDSNTPVAASLPAGTTVTAIAAGGDHSLAIKGLTTPPLTGLPVTGSPTGAAWLAIALTTISTGGVLLVVANQWAPRRRETR